VGNQMMNNIVVVRTPQWAPLIPHSSQPTLLRHRTTQQGQHNDTTRRTSHNNDMTRHAMTMMRQHGPTMTQCWCRMTTQPCHMQQWHSVKMKVRCWSYSTHTTAWKCMTWLKAVNFTKFWLQLDFTKLCQVVWSPFLLHDWSSTFRWLWVD